MQPHTPKCIIVELGKIWAYTLLTIAYVTGTFVAFIVVTDVLTLALALPFNISVGITGVPFVITLLFWATGLLSDSRREMWTTFVKALKFCGLIAGIGVCMVGIFSCLGYLCSLLPWWSDLAMGGASIFAITVFCAADKCGYV
jgi:hypothetical protein